MRPFDRWPSVVLGAARRAAARGRAAPLNVITTTEDLASLAREVGGDRIKVESLARGLPGPALRGGQAQLHDQAQQRRPADRGRPRAGDRLAAAPHHPGPEREDPARRRGLPRRLADRAHPGHPHRPDHPRHGRRASFGQPALLARSRERQAASPRPSSGSCPRCDPADAAYYAARYADFDRRLAAARDAVGRRDGALQGDKVVTYHRSWPNFTDHFGLDVIGYVEPKAGHPALARRTPSPS